MSEKNGGKRCPDHDAAEGQQGEKLGSGREDHSDFQRWRPSGTCFARNLADAEKVGSFRQPRQDRSRVAALVTDHGGGKASRRRLLNHDLRRFRNIPAQGHRPTIRDAAIQSFPIGEVYLLGLQWSPAK